MQGPMGGTAASARSKINHLLHLEKDAFLDPLRVLAGTNVTLFQQLVGLVEPAHVFC